jgi:hypothetical protein
MKMIVLDLDPSFLDPSASVVFSRDDLHVDGGSVEARAREESMGTGLDHLADQPKKSNIRPGQAP